MMNTETITDAKPESEISKIKNTSNVERKERLAGIVTFMAIGGFAAFIILLSLLLAFNTMSDLAWNRYIYLMAGIETITFTAIGWLFGKEVYRGQAEQMEKQMKEMKEESKQQVTSLKSGMEELTQQANYEKEKADNIIKDALTEKERGHALYQAIQQLAKAQEGRELALRDFTDTFALTLLRLPSDTPFNEDTREVSYEFNRMITRFTVSDIYILLDIANQLYPDLKGTFG